MLKSWQSELVDSGIGGKSIANIKIVMNTILNDALDDGIIESNPMNKVKKIPIAKPNIKPFSLEEIKLILQTQKGWFGNFLTFGFFSGARVGEILALQWEDIDFESNKISISRSMRQGLLTPPKTAGSIRRIDMLPIVKEALLKQKALHRSSKWVFPNDRGDAYSDSSCVNKKYWRPLMETMGFKNRVLYHTRHTFASLMISKGEDVLWVSRMLGHTNTNTTFAKYAKFIENDTPRAKFLDGFCA